jgi:hypothetical protein
MAVKDIALKAALEGRTAEQQKVIKYFMAPDGCLSKNISDEEYDKIVWDKINALNLKQRALDRAGFDEFRRDEIPPVELRYWHFGEKTLKKKGLDGLFRSSAYQVTWLFWGTRELFVYQYTFPLDGDEKNEGTEKYAYGDIVGFSVASEGEETEYRESGRGCLNKELSGGRKFIRHDVLYLNTRRGKFGCSMVNNDETAGKIRAMNVRLREKHESPVNPGFTRNTQAP